MKNQNDAQVTEMTQDNDSNFVVLDQDYDLGDIATLPVISLNDLKAA
jgi:hypothetical protein